MLSPGGNDRIEVSQRMESVRDCCGTCEEETFTLRRPTSRLITIEDLSSSVDVVESLTRDVEAIQTAFWIHQLRTPYPPNVLNFGSLYQLSLEAKHREEVPNPQIWYFHYSPGQHSKMDVVESGLRMQSDCPNGWL